HLPTIQRKCQQYQTYRQTGAEQADSNIFPAVIWVAPNPLRAKKLRQAITSRRGIDTTLFRIVEMDTLTDLIAEGSA
ncbi:MAG: replication-relaxation family protein, partial [Jatrophihabitans sp.]